MAARSPSRRRARTRTSRGRSSSTRRSATDRDPRRRGRVPATVAELEADDFTQQEFEYFGGQKVNEVLADSAAHVAEGWAYLPFQVYANSVFNDTVGKAYVSGTPLADGLTAWQDATVTYGKDQGFTVNE